MRAAVAPSGSAPEGVPTTKSKAKAKAKATPPTATMPAARLESLRLALAGADDGAAIDAAATLGT